MRLIFFLVPGLLTGLDLIGCHSLQKSTRFGYGEHQGADNVETFLDCARSCSLTSWCRHATFDPDHRWGNPDINCWLYPSSVTVTQERGYTSVTCSVQTGSVDIGNNHQKTCRKKYRTRYWAHYSQANVDSDSGCAEVCREQSQCVYATYDPRYRTGNTNYNCWLFERPNRVTHEVGFTSFECL